jgi:hypothetical protein
MHNLFSLPCLLAIQTKGKEPLVDHSQSHVVTSYQYLDIMRKKAMDKKIIKKSKKKKQKKGKKFEKNNKYGDYNRSSSSKNC